MMQTMTQQYSPPSSAASSFMPSGSSSPSISSENRSRSGSSAFPQRPGGLYGASNTARRRGGRIFRSTKIDPEVYKSRVPWYDTPNGKSTLRRTRWTCLGVSVIGLLGAAAIVVTGILSVPMHKYCLVLDEQFDGGKLNPDVWQHEIQVGGFGNHEFEMTTDSTDNAFIDDGKLYIVPTLSNETYGNDAIMNGYLLNLTTDGTCTGTTDQECAVFSSNQTGNYSVLPPIRSARLTTRLSHSIKYGKIEVKARMPTGDWIWPAIWMLPTNNVYGQWPLSGEIDIAETKGNQAKNSWDLDNNVVTSSLHWGLDTNSDMYKKTLSWRKLKRNFVNQASYVYGLNWDVKGLRTWQSKPSWVIKTLNFNQPFYERGNLADALVNGTHPGNPWLSSNNTNAAPFDQDFYLVLSVAVGGTNGWFPDAPNKPWSNGSPSAARDFWVNRNKWLPSWPADPKKRGMEVESVKMWRLAEPGETCPS